MASFLFLKGYEAGSLAVTLSDQPSQSIDSNAEKQGTSRAATRFLNVALKLTRALVWFRSLGSAEDTGQRAVGMDTRDMVDSNTVIHCEGATNVEVSRAVWQRDDGEDFSIQARFSKGGDDRAISIEAE